MYYYLFNIGDYQSHTGHLSELEDLAYRRLLDWCYLHEKPLPNNVDDIGRLIRMRTHCECIATVLREFFELTDEGWISNRILVEIEKVNQKSSKASASARARWEKSKDANALQTQSERNATQDTRPITQNTNKVATAPESVDKSVWEDFLKIRKAKRAPMTATALEAIKREAEKAGWPLNDAIRECVTRGWQGFKADWVEHRKVTGPDPGLAKLKEDEKLARPMPANVRQMLQSAVKRMP